MSFEQGKVAIVTGGASGIGLAIVKKFLQQGAKGVGVVDICEETGKKVVSSLEKEYGDKVIFIEGDVSKEEDVRNAFNKMIERFKNLDIVVNNAGIEEGPNYEKVVSINLLGVMHGTYIAVREYLPKYKSSDEALVLNTASVLGLNSSALGSTYSATKHGVVGLGKAFGEDESCLKNKIRVITICPGVILTPSIADMISKNSELQQQLFEISKKMSSSEYVADALQDIMKKGNNGSVWVAENDEPPYEVTFLHREEMRKTS
ncbi:15-hydroxyprostaglandin dehydrogenase [NAD(+)] isoform X2 [Leptinotarsa decemlineata]|uniref:15-hydroxyprostaglandin dehydrogenase [NAD(+)] isoform X2 n=1 Tax=Leptinotarsa decemlineata TaxID=7539 RepID=UPI003D30789F